MVSSITEGSGFVLDIIEQLKEPDANSHESRNDILPQNIVTKKTKQNNTQNGQVEHVINDTLEVILRILDQIF